MLRELSVHNLALIEDVRVELQPGFCAWTGETGAGKTLLLEALGLLLGERGSADLLRTGAQELRVVGTFDVAAPIRPRLEVLLNAPCDEEHLLVMRRLNASGRSSAYVNDQPVTMTTLQQVGSLLVDIHGQHESQSLLEPAYQLRLLDGFGGLEKLRQAYIDHVERVRGLRRKLEHLDANRQNRLRELNLVRFEKEEIDRAELVAGEMVELQKERERLIHAQALRDFAQGTVAKLYDDEGSVFEVLGKLQKDAEHWASVDTSLASVAEGLASLAAQTQDVVHSLRPLEERWQTDPGRHEEVEDRLQLLRRLEAKYGKPVDDLIAYRAGLDALEKELSGQEEDRSSLARDLLSAYAALREAADKLSQQRHKVARKFAAQVQEELSDLGMAEAKLDVNLDPIELPEEPPSELPADGCDRLEILLAANRGEPSRPLRKVASGGEMSRIMLALKTVLAGQDQVGTLIFDEIDANVGGRLGDILGSKLAALGKSHQVICVTHLPQVASYARHQWTIRKTRKGKRTTTTIDLLAETDRLEELASMLRGTSRGETTRQEAAAMLAAARKKWQ